MALSIFRVNGIFTAKVTPKKRRASRLPLKPITRPCWPRTAFRCRTSSTTGAWTPSLSPRITKVTAVSSFICHTTRCTFWQWDQHRVPKFQDSCGGAVQQARFYHVTVRGDGGRRQPHVFQHGQQQQPCKVLGRRRVE